MAAATDEKAIREARRKLRERLQCAVRSVDRRNQAIADQLFNRGFGHFFNEYKLDDAERALTEATAAFTSRLVDLMTFDLANNIEADYPSLPVLDREATIAAGRAHYERRMAEIRARIERDGRLPRTTPT